MGPENRQLHLVTLGLPSALLLCIALLLVPRAALHKINASGVVAMTSSAAAATDIITLDNFADKLPKWQPDDDNHLHALVDMGSNGIRFSISDLSPPRTRLLPCVYRERAGISLFDALTAVDDSTSGEGPAGNPSAMKLPAETIRQVARTLARFRRIALDYGVAPGRMAVFATEAMRRAANAGALLEAIASAAPGLSVHVLAPEVETLFGSTGARSGFAVVGNSDTGAGGLMLDLGGGSVQMTYVDPRLGPGYEVAAARAGQSMPYGAARLTRLVSSATPPIHDVGSELQFDKKLHHLDAERIRLAAEAKAEADSRATAEAAPKLADDMTAALARLHEQFPSLLELQKRQQANKTSEGGIDVYLCGGGFRGYGSMLMQNDAVQPYPVPLMGGYTVPGSFFRDTHRMRRVNHELAGGKIFGMSKRRRQQFAAITAVVDALIVALQRSSHTIRSVTFCAGGNREGALMMRLPATLREADPLSVHVETAATSSSYSRGRTGDDVVAAIQSTAEALLSALPPLPSSSSSSSPSPAQPSWAPLRPLLPLFATHIWERTGADSSANAAFVLHDAVVRNPGMPGLTHQARAILAVSLWARWGGGVAPTDTPLLDGLRQLLDRPSGGGGSSSSSSSRSGTDDDGDLMFWAEYMGGVAAVLALVFPAGPPNAAELASIRFEPMLSTTKSGKTAVHLDVAVAASRAVGLDVAEAVTDCFSSVGKSHKETVKLRVQAQEFSE
ncbi:retrograde regulation protein 2 [Sporothrix schenckii 1099-18]|uniref:Retrograde regulation protein 2 n=1 Tax=Sporothrix schenckii 1099-18 TaxID=1397361 RepID=A0A0F2M370_SPOSC|nr:retrograde regulation protein 2 [Sporothrix schenckii 1099-18]KJR82586.1 retrograde regulation protein 2 [Sporothrix schenckii 1099-18]